MQPPTSIARGSDGRLAGLAQLTDKQRAFAKEYARNGGDAVNAGRVAGYADPEGHAYEVARLPHVLDAVYAEQDLWIAGLMSKALKSCEEILDHQGKGRDIKALKVQVTKALFTRSDQRHRQRKDAEGGNSSDHMDKEKIAELRRMVDDWKAQREKMVDITPTPVD